MEKNEVPKEQLEEIPKNIIKLLNDK